jgi:hypothetical protein
MTGKLSLKKEGTSQEERHLPSIHQLMDLAESQHEATQSKDIFIFIHSNPKRFVHCYQKIN